MQSLKVPIGTSTKVGYGVGLAGAVASVLVLIFKDDLPYDQALAIATVGIGLVSYVQTQHSRAGQAKALAQRVPLAVHPDWVPEPTNVQSAPAQGAPSSTTPTRGPGGRFQRKAAIVPGSFGDVEPPKQKEQS